MGNPGKHIITIRMYTFPGGPISTPENAPPRSEPRRMPNLRKHAAGSVPVPFFPWYGRRNSLRIRESSAFSPSIPKAMSYQSIKRVLGESRLERKCLLLFGVCLLGLILASFLIYGNQTEKLVDETEKLSNAQNRNHGKLLVDQMMYIEHWERLNADPNDPQALELVKYLTATLSKEDYRGGFIKPDGNSGIPIIEPVRTRESADVSGGSSDSANTSLPPKKEPLSAFDEKVLQECVKVGSSQSNTPKYFEDQSNPTEYVYYQPIWAEEEACAICHHAMRLNTFQSPQPAGGELGVGTPVSKGDLLAIAKVTITNPYQSTQDKRYENRAILWTTAIVTASLAMFGSYLIIRYVIVKPLRHLRDVSDAISHGDHSQRAEISTGDEFETLAVAFNRMLGHLVSAQEELRQVNADLDGKVDELAQVNMRLYEMNTIKSDFLATMSHELRTPLNSILGFSDVLGSIDSLDEKQRRYVKNIQTSGRMLLEMINDILDLAKIESGKMEIKLTDFHLAQVIAAQCDMARPLTEKKNIDLLVRVREDLPPMHQDQARVQQILNNLLSNAIKFTPEGGRITVTAGRDGEQSLVMQVADTGVGIAEEDQQVIFEKFRQGRQGVLGGDAMTREYSGSGLGLSIVKELCKLLGGEVKVESELGKGSTFTVRLPWKLQEQPRLDSALVEGFEEFTKPRLDFPTHHVHEVASVESQAGK